MPPRFVEEVIDLQLQLKPYMPADRPEPAHWISTPDGDHGDEWCSVCGYYKVRNLRRHDRKNRQDYILDGGWLAESDIFPNCAGCGKQLDILPTDYCIAELIENFEGHGFYEDTKTCAFEIDEILEYVSYRSSDDPEMETMRQAAIKIATDFLKTLQTQYEEG